jgi:hypothetical protein
MSVPVAAEGGSWTPGVSARVFEVGRRHLAVMTRSQFPAVDGVP